MKSLRDHQPRQVRKLDHGGAEEPTWKRQQARLARRSGGREQPASGATPFRKGDVDAGELLIEAKATDAASMVLKQAWLTKVTQEAAAFGKTPALAVTFANTPPGTDRDWVMVPAAFLFGDPSAG